MADDNAVIDFSDLKKKKKKAVRIASDDEGDSAPAPTKTPKVDALGNAIEDDAVSTTDSKAPSAVNGDAAGDDDPLDFSDLKKKKKKKAVRIASDDEGDSAPASAKTPKVDALGNAIEDDAAPAGILKDTSATNGSAAGGDDDDLDNFADLKKKKKKGTKKPAFDLEAFERELAETEAAKGDDDDEGADRIADEDDEPEGDDPFGGEEGALSKAGKAAEVKAWLKDGSRDYEYIELLGRFYASLYVSHPSLSASGTKRKYTLAPPQMYREGSKRSVFANVVDISKKMNRQPEHVIQFLFAELGTTGSVDANGQLVIKGRFQQKQMEIVLRRYIAEYVACKTCKSPDTKLTKDNRLFFMTCESCGSTRSVTAIKSGFAAQIGKRKLNKV